MFHIAIVSGSVRIGRESNYVAKYFDAYIKVNNLATTEILDLKEFNFPVFEERLSKTLDPSVFSKLFSEKIANADAVIVVFPEYNGGYSAGIKNAIDLLYNEWHHKPIGLVSVSSGNFGGVNALSLLQSVFFKIRAVTIPVTFPVPNVHSEFDENGVPFNKELTDQRASTFLKELIWFAEAFDKMKA
jgi:NAD(P)H-dependent FMN reductase